MGEYDVPIIAGIAVVVIFSASIVTWALVAHIRRRRRRQHDLETASEISEPDGSLTTVELDRSRNVADPPQERTKRHEDSRESQSNANRAGSPETDGYRRPPTNVRGSRKTHSSHRLSSASRRSSRSSHSPEKHHTGRTSASIPLDMHVLSASKASSSSSSSIPSPPQPLQSPPPLHTGERPPGTSSTRELPHTTPCIDDNIEPPRYDEAVHQT